MTFIALIFCLVLSKGVLFAKPLEDTKSPSELASWADWVLYEEEYYLCPPLEGEYSETNCVLPITLSITLDNKGGSFTGSWSVKTESLVRLPGDEENWPTQVHDRGSLFSTSLAVIGDNVPMVRLEAGEYNITGEWSWNSLPDTLTLPLGAFPLITVNGQELEFPAMDISYQSVTQKVWLKGPDQLRPFDEDEEETDNTDDDTGFQQNSVTVRVDRLILDEQPMKVRTQLQLSVSGTPREELIKDVLLPNSTALSLNSPLPARLTAEGLRVQARAGVWFIIIDSMQPMAPVNTLGPASGNFGSEYWAFSAMPSLRQVKVSGAPQVDPTRVDSPWPIYPVFELGAGERLEFTTLRRGDPEPGPNQLHLVRNCWLDYSGDGLTCRDNLNGLMQRDWHLSVDAPFSLGSATLSGVPQVITFQKNSKGDSAPGLQLRQGRVQLSADLRIENFNGEIPASGWDQNLETSNQTLELPPGYFLFFASGAEALGPDGYPADWWDKWTTLDLFIVLVIIAATYKLLGRRWAILAGIAIILSYHEYMCPRLVYLHILAAMAILKVLPETGKARFLVRGWKLLSCLVLLVFVVTFVILQLRWAIYPQLFNPNYGTRGIVGYPVSAGINLYLQGPLPTPSADVLLEESPGAYMEPEAYDDPLPLPRHAALESNDFSMSADSSRRQMPPSPLSKSDGPMNSQQSQRLDETAQNSIPRPDWRWNRIILNYNGQVTRDQDSSLLIFPPIVSSFFGILRAILIAWFSLAILGIKRPETIHPKLGKLVPNLLIALILCPFFLLSFATLAQGQNSQYPPRELLDELGRRLRESPDTLPAGIPTLTIRSQPGTIFLSFEVESEEDGFVPLPNIDRKIFQPQRAYLSSDEDVPILYAHSKFWAYVPKGNELLTLTGRIKEGPSFLIVFQADPKPKRIILETDSYEIASGTNSNGYLVSHSLNLTYKGPNAASVAPIASPPEASLPQTESPLAPSSPQTASPATGTSYIKPFFQVQRTISLGVDMKIYTTVNPTVPLEAPYTLTLPLVPGESPTTSEDRIAVIGNKASLDFSPQTSSISWESTLKVQDNTLTLSCEDGPYEESWILDAGSLWSVDTEGLVPIHSLDSSGYWNPQWRPWPGESLTIKLSKPEAVPGADLVVDSGQMFIEVGTENRRVNLTLKLRASMGRNHTFELPEGAELIYLRLGANDLPFSHNSVIPEGHGPTVTIPLNPGENLVSLEWQEPSGVSILTRASLIDLDLLSSNISIVMRLPLNYWTLFVGGPAMGPAVLFWSFAIAMLIFSYILGLTKLTPLNTLAWFLFFLGLSQLSVVSAIIVAAYFLVLGLRGTKEPIKRPILFNIGQIVLCLWTILALYLIYRGLTHGLLEAPNMSVTGNHSTDHYLNWFQDRTTGPWPVPWVFTIPNFIYQYLMLAWALWLAIHIIRWSRWGWRSFSNKALWKKSEKKSPPTAPQAYFPPGAASVPQAPLAPQGPQTPQGPIEPPIWGGTMSQDQFSKEPYSSEPAAEAPQAPDDPESPKAPEDPESPQAPKAPEDPESPQAPQAPEDPESPQAPESPQDPDGKKP
jgi:hypothetical protein